MFIRVDLPAPFSPSSACTSPSSSSKSTWSLASTPGNCFVIPRSSRTGVPGIRRDSVTETEEAGTWPASSMCRRAMPLLELVRHLDLAGLDQVLQLRELRLVGRRDLRADLADRDAAVLEVEDEVVAGDQRSRLDGLDEPEDAEIDALDCAGQDVRAQVRLVDVDAVAPDTRLLRRRERAEAARAGDREDDLRTGRDLVLRDRLALVLRDEVLRVADQDLRPGHALRSTGAVAGDERVDRRDLHAARGADRVAASALRHQRGEAADQVALLLGLERDPGDVLDDELPGLVRERRDLDRVVRDRELGVRELLRDRRFRICEQEARRDDRVI